MGRTGDPPVPSGDSPLGTEKREKHLGSVANQKFRQATGLIHPGSMKYAG